MGYGVLRRYASAVDGGDPTIPVDAPDQARSGDGAAIHQRLSQVDEMIAPLQTLGTDKPTTEGSQVSSNHSAPPATDRAEATTQGDDPAVLKLAALAQVETILSVARSKAAELAEHAPEAPADAEEVASVMDRL